MIEKLVWMKGKTFATLSQNKKFEIVDVTADVIAIRIFSTHNIRIINKKRIENAWKQLINDGQITQKQVYDTGTVNSAYIVAILANTQGVQGKIKPARLIYLERGK